MELYPALDSSAGRRHGPTGACPEKGHEKGQIARERLHRQARTVEAAQLLEKGRLWREHMAALQNLNGL